MFINHVFARPEERLPEIGQHLYEYVIAGNGIFVRAKRPGLEAMIPVQYCSIAGLPVVEPYVQLQTRVPQRLILAALRWSAEAMPNEALFWYSLDTDTRIWTVLRPRQIRSRSSVRPTEPHNAFGAAALIDLHSHNSMRPFFSSTDNRDETGFRIYAVIGSINLQANTRPMICARVGIYGHTWRIPAQSIFDLPHFLQDVEQDYE